MGGKSDRRIDERFQRGYSAAMKRALIIAILWWLAS
jgi:hypothetical protein